MSVLHAIERFVALRCMLLGFGVMSWLLPTQAITAQAPGITGGSGAIASGAPQWIDAAMEASDAGYVMLRWQPHVAISDGSMPDGPVEFQLQESRGADFEDPTTRYQGNEQSSFISGLEDGVYFFRVRQRHGAEDVWGSWSEAKELRVMHHSLAFALWMFALGAAVFSSIVITVWRGNRGKGAEAEIGESAGAVR